VYVLLYSPPPVQSSRLAHSNPTPKVQKAQIISRFGSIRNEAFFLRCSHKKRYYSSLKTDHSYPFWPKNSCQLKIPVPFKITGNDEVNTVTSERCQAVVVNNYSNTNQMGDKAVLWNRNDLLGFRFCSTTLR
jgi:hypothetical protein